MKRHYLPLLLSLLVAPVLVTYAATQTADEVIEKHLAAMGGREALGKLTSRKATGTMTVTTPNGNISGPFELYSKAPNKARLYVVLDLTPMGMNDKLTLDQKFDGTTGWALNTLQGDRQITGNQLENMKNSVFPNPLLNYKASGATVELLPNETVAGKSLIVMKITPKTGSATKLFLDPDTYLMVRTSLTINSPEMGGNIEQVNEASDYRTVDGVKFAFKSVQSSSVQSATLLFDKVEHNVTLDDAMFSVK
jgi:outer membrane lipoprotein-sorting protein